MSINLSLLSPEAVTPALTAKLRRLATDLDRIAAAGGADSGRAVAGAVAGRLAHRAGT